MPRFDLLIRGGEVVSAVGIQKADIGVAAEKIAELGPCLEADAKEVVEANGLHVFPGVIDAHVHFNEPGRTHWEGFATGTRALAAGGATMYFDMPLNAHPPTTDAESFGLKRQAAEKNSLLDFSLWGGLVPGNLDQLEELADCGVIGFKAFMCNSGMEDFPCIDHRTLREGMKRAANLRLPVAVHAESEELTRELAQQCIAGGRTAVRDYLDSRPVRAELEAIGSAIELAAETGCRLHIVHVSCGAGVERVANARRRGVDVSCESCPHYLVLSEKDAEQLSAIAKCAPPLRAPIVQEELWRHLLAGDVTTVGSDHSPALPEMKEGADFFKTWGGISGAQHTFPLLLTDGHFKHKMPLPHIAALLSANVAGRFNLPVAKGRLETGADADLALVDLGQHYEVEKTALLYRHPQSPYIGRSLRGRVVRTLSRGRTIWRDGEIVGDAAGRLVKPIR